MLTAAEIRNTQFALTGRRSGYDPEEVDDFLARAEAEVGRLTAAEIRNTRFAMTRGYPGYEPREVDAFLARLIGEKEELDGIIPPPSGSARPSRSGTRHGRHGRRQGDGEPFKLALVCALLFLAAAVGCGFGMAALHADGERSSVTQRSGIAETATVTSVTTTGPKNPQTDISVILGTPVDYQFVSDVHVPGDHGYNTGDKIRILVDPRDPSYSELPGQPDTRLWTMMIIAAVMILWLAVTAALCLARAFRIWQGRRQFRRQLPAS